MTDIAPTTHTIYEFIRDYLKAERRSPAQREIAEGCYLAHTTVLTHLARLEGMGWIEREPNIARSIRLGPLAPDYEPEEENAS